MEYYFSEEILEDKIILLRNEEFIHCTKVMRHKVGDSITVINGKGLVYIAGISEIKRNEAKLIIQEIVQQRKFNPESIVAISPTKNPSRLEWFVEKATEFGVSGIIILRCERSDKKSAKLDRLKKIIIGAAKQSGNTFFPFLLEADNVEKISEFYDLSLCKKYIAHCQMKENHLLTVADASQPQLVLIGPEGDFTQAEIEWAVQNQFIPVSLGKSRLRTETAGLYALFCLNAGTT